MTAAINPQMRWDVHQHGLWLQLMTLSCPTLGDCFDSENLIQKSNDFNSPHALVGQVVQPCLVCWEFNTKGFCNRKPFRFRHQ